MPQNGATTTPANWEVGLGTFTLAILVESSVTVSGLEATHLLILLPLPFLLIGAALQELPFRVSNPVLAEMQKQITKQTADNVVPMPAQSSSAPAA